MIEITLAVCFMYVPSGGSMTNRPHESSKEKYRRSVKGSGLCEVC
jgi:hypothetical protein